jgi:hypothetical protein
MLPFGDCPEGIAEVPASWAIAIPATIATDCMDDR